MREYNHDLAVTHGQGDVGSQIQTFSIHNSEGIDTPPYGASAAKGIGEQTDGCHRPRVVSRDRGRSALHYLSTHTDDLIPPASCGGKHRR